MKKFYRFVVCAFLPCSLFILSCTSPFDPEKEIRIYYESPRGCDEVSGLIQLKASVRGDGAPVPAAMKYSIWTSEASDALIYKGYPPDYSAEFDSTAIRDGFARYSAVPLDESGKAINIKGFPYNAKGILPSFKGFMIRNKQFDLSRPLIVMGAPIEPDTGALEADRLSEQLMSHLIFSASLMTHLQSYGFIPTFCAEDQTTVVLDPFNLSTRVQDAPQNPVDLMAQPVDSFIRWNPGNLCFTSPFFEAPVPNGIPDIWECTALENILLYDTLGPVNSKPQAMLFFKETVDSLAGDYNLAGDWFSMFEFEKPVPFEEDEDLLQKKLEGQILNGASAVFVYDFYNKANEFEMSSGSWPHFQQSLDKANKKLGTAVPLGAIATNKHQLMNYEDFNHALFLGVRHLVASFAVPADKKLGIIIAAHGSSTTNRLYDVSNIVNNPIMNQNIKNYFDGRKADIHASSPPCPVCYSEYSNKADDGLPGVGEQVRDWVDEGYDYIFVFPMEWTWASRDGWLALRENTVELLSLDEKTEQQVFARDKNNRSIAAIGKTVLVIGETIFDQKNDNPDAYNFLKTAAAKLLEDRLLDITSSPAPRKLN
ncbi:MAG: hypothetical protein WCQ99_06590 [Pseudomonadota bacterium]